MSGYPHKEGVTKVRDLILGQKSTGDLISELRERIAADSLALQLAQGTYSSNARDIYDEMQRMDLTSTGNTGHEQRMQTFLVMLTDLTIQAFK